MAFSYGNYSSITSSFSVYYNNVHIGRLSTDSRVGGNGGRFDAFTEELGINHLVVSLVKTKDEGAQALLESYRERRGRAMDEAKDEREDANARIRKLRSELKRVT